MTGAACIHEVIRPLFSSFVPKPCWQPGVRTSMVEDGMQISWSHLSTCTGGNPGRLLYTRGLLSGGCSRGGDSEGGNSGRSE